MSDERARREIAQDTLFGEPPPLPPPSPLAPLPLVTGATSLEALAAPYRQFLIVGGHTPHTIDCFLSDLRLLTRHLGATTPVGQLTAADLAAWLRHLRFESAAPPAPKTMARRITFLKNCFGWLAAVGARREDLSAAIARTRPLPPLPDLLFENDLAALVEAATADARGHLLIMLALDAGLKKEEILALTPERVDLSDPARPTVSVRLPGPGKATRERTMGLPPEFSAVYTRYLRSYQPQGALFDCTERTLTNILARAAAQANLARRVTLQGLRDCYAVRQLRAGVPLDQLREKLGLTPEAWYETADKYRKLAFPL